MAAPGSLAPYDALLIVSFGGPEKPDDVLPFLENVTQGRGIPRERLAEVGSHYHRFGGRSPLNDQCRELISAVRQDLVGHDVALPIYWGNRNWDPYLSDAFAEMSNDGIRRAAAFVTSAYASYSGCRQYREDLARAADSVPRPPRVDKLRHYFNHPGFVAAFVDNTARALAALPDDVRGDARLVFVTHSIPVGMADTSGPAGNAYVEQHRSVAESVAAAVESETGATHDWDLVYCSRSGSPEAHWLEPDVNDHLEKLAAGGVDAVVVVPIGFVSDHMEVVYDLDTEAAATAERLGVAFARAGTPGIHPAFVATVRELVVERAAAERAAAERAATERAAAERAATERAAAERATAERGDAVRRPALGRLGPGWDVCERACCPNLRGHKPALSERALEGTAS
jgi:ferrochelatase